MIKFLAHKSGSTLISANGFVDVPSRTVFSLDDHVLESGLFDEFISRGILKVFQTAEAASAWLAEEDLVPAEQSVNSVEGILAAVTPATEVVSSPEAPVAPAAEEIVVTETAEAPIDPAVEAPTTSVAPAPEEAVTSEVAETPSEPLATPAVEESAAEVPDPDVAAPVKKTRAKQS